MERLLSFLESIYPMSEALVEYLRSALKKRELLKNDFLLENGKVCNYIYFIETGLLRCFYQKRGVQVSSWFMTEGNVIISVSSFFGQAPSREAIQALEDAVVWGISYKQLEHIYKTFLEFNVHGRVLSHRYYAISDEQLYAIRMQRAHERYQHLMDTQPELFARVPAKYIASFLGISEETLSRIRHRKKPNAKKLTDINHK